MKRLHLRALVLSLGVALIATFAAPSTSLADPFDGDIITSHKRIPTSAKSKKAYFAKLRKANSKKFRENKEKQEWKIYFAAFFRRPLNDLEVTIKLYDVTDKQKHMKGNFEQYLEGRGQKSLISYIKLDRETFGVNRKILMTVENRGRVLAKTTFEIQGEVERYSGQADFTDEE
ncbi:hypothetical protein [Haliangium ochraceum]|uniref:Lipoprotein n=1 Tax=Haliangium ochraceum (strain DSM 14365 / JCM 11303 / SMP-2) TaxID=502025 RepID=D0LY70_HALO1|nr:hypothetical protein [Haliangium ochraceum]ACY16220.1 hypothetical protein Hoch_3720 [Haliangium ochraceum DSM 14365]